MYDLLIWVLRDIGGHRILNKQVELQDIWLHKFYFDKIIHLVLIIMQLESSHMSF